MHACLYKWVLLHLAIDTGWMICQMSWGLNSCSLKSSWECRFRASESEAIKMPVIISYYAQNLTLCQLETTHAVKLQVNVDDMIDSLTVQAFQHRHLVLKVPKSCGNSKTQEKNAANISYCLFGNVLRRNRATNDSNGGCNCMAENCSCCHTCNHTIICMSNCCSAQTGNVHWQTHTCNGFRMPWSASGDEIQACQESWYTPGSLQIFT